MGWTTRRPRSTDESLREMELPAGPCAVGEVRGMGGTFATKRTKPDWYRGGHLLAEPVGLRGGQAWNARSCRLCRRMYDVRAAHRVLAGVEPRDAAAEAPGEVGPEGGVAT